MYRAVTSRFLTMPRRWAIGDPAPDTAASAVAWASTRAIWEIGTVVEVPLTFSVSEADAALWETSAVRVCRSIPDTSCPMSMVPRGARPSCRCA